MRDGEERDGQKEGEKGENGENVWGRKKREEIGEGE